MPFPPALLSEFPYIPVVTVVFGLTMSGIVATMAIFTEARRKERALLYRTELMKKLADSSGPAAEQVLAMLREDEAGRRRRVREGWILAGLILVFVAVGVIVAGIAAVARGPNALREESLWMWGLLPLMIGLAFLIHAKWIVQKPTT